MSKYKSKNVLILSRWKYTYNLIGEIFLSALHVFITSIISKKHKVALYISLECVVIHNLNKLSPLFEL
jgi:hypothetical protein